VERNYEYDEDKVLRTVYLPKSLDKVIRVLSYRGRKSKNAVILELIVARLKDDGHLPKHYNDHKK